MIASGFFFALGYLGWFLSPLVLVVSTAGVLVVMARRQFSSDGRAAVFEQLPDGEALQEPVRSN